MQVGDLVKYIGKRKHIKTVGMITRINGNKSVTDVLWGCGRHFRHGSRHLKPLKENTCK